MTMQNQKGFGHVEIILIIVFLAFIVVGGWYVWQANNSGRSTSTTTTPTEVVDPYKDWLTHTFKYEKFSLKYPATFTLEDTSNELNEAVTPGSDNVRFTKQNGFRLSIGTGISGVGGACDECKVIRSQQMTFLGQPASVNFVDNDNSGKVASIVVTKNNDDWFGIGLKGKNITSTFDGEVLPMSIAMSYRQNDQLVNQDLNTLLASEDFKDGMKILESASY